MMFPLLVAAAAAAVIPGEIHERDGIGRQGTLIEQGIPVAPMPEAEARALVLRGANGSTIPSEVWPEARDENGNVRWLRVSALVRLPAHGTLPVRIEPGRSSAPPLRIERRGEQIEISTAAYRLRLRQPDWMELKARNEKLLSGKWNVDLRPDARGLLWGSVFREFVPTGIEVEQESPARATVVLKGFYTKNYRKQAGVLEPGRRFDCELRLQVNSLSPQIRYSWRLTNLFGHKTWLETYAVILPTAGTSKESQPDRLMLSTGLGVTADFIEDLGEGAGIRRGATGLTVGGLKMPPDGGFYAARVPPVHRLFYNGMSRTFTGSLVTTGSWQDSAEERAPLDLVLAPQYYSDVKALPEQGDPVTFGEFETAIRRSAEWLLANQWCGTLLWGEWWREEDKTHNQGTQESGNGHSPLAPLYHYWRTGDARFLWCARRSAQYVWDVQLSKSTEHQGRMFHTRRHLFDELDWIHPRYQRATGGLVASHVILNPVMRKEIIETVRSFHKHMFDEKGVPHDWDKIADKRSPKEAGVDTSNFMEALAWCYRETGERRYLDWALAMSRWTAARWRRMGKTPNDDWNWNLSNYVLRGLLTLYEASRDEEVKKLAIEIASTTLRNTSPDTGALQNGMGGGNLHFVFYHAWVSTRVAKIAPNGAEMVRTLLEAVRRDVREQCPNGQFLTQCEPPWTAERVWASYYDPKSFVAFVPVLTAHLARQANQ